MQLRPISILFLLVIGNLQLSAQVESGLAIDRNSILVPPYKKVPYTQVQAIYLGGGLVNTGTQPLEGTWLAASVFDTLTQMVVYADTIEYGLIEAGDSSGQLVFPSPFLPKDDQFYHYQLTYEVGGDSVMINSEDQSFHYAFDISERVYAKTTDTTQLIAVQPDTSLFIPGQPVEWGMSTHYFIQNATDSMGEQLYATHATVGLADIDRWAGRKLIFWLHTWDDVNSDEIAIGGGGNQEIEFLGFATYEITGDETSSFISVPLIDPACDPVDPTRIWHPWLVAESNYILEVVLCADESETIHSILGESIPQLEATKDFYSEEGMPRYSNGLRINKTSAANALGESIFFSPIAPPDSTNFGNAFIPYLFLETGLQPAFTVNTLDWSTDYQISAYPNPSDEQLFIDLDLPESIQQINLQLYNQQGQRVINTSYENFIPQSIEWNVASLLPGIYLLSIQTNEGSQSKVISIF